MYAEASRILTPASVFTFSEGDTLKISIIVTGIPEPTITWQRNNEDIDYSRFMMAGANLSLANVQHTDAGVYTLTASNVADTVQESYNVIIQCKL